MLVDGTILKAQLGGIQSELDFNTVETFVKFAERRFRSEVNQDVYDYLSTLTPDSENEEELRDLAYAWISWLAYDMSMPNLKFRVGDMGMMKVAPPNSVAITKWEYVDTREANWTMVDLARENFFQLLESMELEEWTNSTAYQKRHGYFIQSVSELSEEIPLVGRNTRFFQQLLTYIDKAENMHLKPVLTAGVFDGLKTKMKDPDQTLTDLEKGLVLHIKKAVAHLALYEAYPFIPLAVDQEGVREVRKKDGTREEEIAEKSYRNAQRIALHDTGRYYLKEIRNYLDQHATSSIFASYYNAKQTDDFEEDYTDKPCIVL